MATANRPVSFALHILPLFRTLDVDHMKVKGSKFDLTAYADVKRKATDIHQRLANKDDPMPPEDDAGPWPDEWVALFKRWIDEGLQP